MFKDSSIYVIDADNKTQAIKKLLDQLNGDFDDFIDHLNFLEYYNLDGYKVFENYGSKPTKITEYSPDHSDYGLFLKNFIKIKPSPKPQELEDVDVELD